MVGGFQYRIIAAVEEDGHPCWELYRDCVNPFVFSSVLLASNRDREVLEKAIEHLNGNEPKKLDTEPLCDGEVTLVFKNGEPEGVRDDLWRST